MDSQAFDYRKASPAEVRQKSGPPQNRMLGESVILNFAYGMGMGLAFLMGGSHQLKVARGDLVEVLKDE